MEVRGNRPDPVAGTKRYEDMLLEIAARNRAKVRQTSEKAVDLAERRHEGQRAEREAKSKERAHEDRIELSEGARRLTEQGNEMAAKVKRLSAQHESGRLNTAERVDEAARNMLR